MSRHDGTSAGSKSAEEGRKPFVLEKFDTRSFVYKPVKNGRYATLDEAVAAATGGDKFHVVTFDPKTRKPTVVWEKR